MSRLRHSLILMIMNEVETAEIFERFLNEVGMWQKFEEFIKKEV